MDTLRICEWSYAEWQEREAEWNALLARSGQDPLFLSWEWMSIWWRVFGQGPGHALCLLAAYRGDELVGIAPLYRSTAIRQGLRMRTLQFIGQSWRDANVVTAEYVDVIATRAHRDRVRSAFMQHLARDRRWSELIVNRSTSPEEWNATFQGARGALSYPRNLDVATSHQADLSQGFDIYLSRLGQSTRRSAFNLRRRVGKKSVFEPVPASHVQDAFAELNLLHMLRWNRPAFVGKRLQFQMELTQRLAPCGELRMSRLSSEGRVLSMLMDIRKGSRQYNIKMAYDPHPGRSVSVGLIHLGYALEEAAAQGVATYDFLAGRGLKTDYKRHLSQLTQTMRTVQLVRGVALTSVYRTYDTYKRMQQMSGMGLAVASSQYLAAESLDAFAITNLMS